LFPNVLVGLVHILDRQDGQKAIIPKVSQRDPRTRLDIELGYCLLGKVERDGNAEQIAVCKADIIDDAMYIY
jgi:hypothetical protein